MFGLIKIYPGAKPGYKVCATANPAIPAQKGEERYYVYYSPDGLLRLRSWPREEAPESPPVTELYCGVFAKLPPFVQP